VAAELVMTIIYSYAMLARFVMSTKEILKNAVLMVNRHLPISLLCLALLAGTLYVPLGLNLGAAIVMFGVFFYVYVSGRLWVQAVGMHNCGLRCCCHSELVSESHYQIPLLYRMTAGTAGPVNSFCHCRA
jgi:hypothetical protein